MTSPFRMWGLLAGIAAAAAAQEPLRAPGSEIAGATLLATDSARFDDPADPGGRGRVRLQEASLLAPLGEWPAGPLTLGAAAWAGGTRLEFQNAPGLGTEDLRGAALALSAAPAAPGTWTWAVLLMPGYYGEARLMAQAQAARRLSAAWRLEFGAAWDDAFGDPQLFPVGGAVWQPADDFALRLVFPAASAYWAPAADLGLFALLQPAGDRWVTRDGGDEWVFILQGWRAGLGAERRLWKGLWLRLAAGREFGRHYEARRDGRRELDEDADDAWFAALTLAVY